MTASTRIIEGSGITVTPSWVLMTSATTRPTWLFIRVTPHLFDEVLSDLYGLSAVRKAVTGSAPSGSAGSGRRGWRRNGSWPGPGRPRTAGAWRRAATTAAAARGPP